MTEEGDLEKSYVVVTNIKMYAGVLPPLCRLWVSGKGAGKHANFIINRGRRSSDVYTLICRVKDEVYKKFGVTLKEEVCYIGDFE